MGAKEEDPGEASGVEPSVVVALEGAVRDRHGPSAVVTDEQDRAAKSLARLSVNTLPPIESVIGSPSLSITPPLPPPGVPERAGLAPMPMARLPTKRLFKHHPGHTDAAQRAAVAADIDAEAAVDDVHRKIVLLGDGSNRSASMSGHRDRSGCP
jgi:hypothetical protein